MNRVLLPARLPAQPLMLNPAHRVFVLRGDTMGTHWSVTVSCAPDRPLATTADRIARLLDDIVRQMSTWSPLSEISRFNAARPGASIQISPAFQTVLAHALATARDSDGAYDPTIGPLVDLWGFGPAGRRTMPPDSWAIDQARARCGWPASAGHSVASQLTQPGGMAIDLSSIAKGYAVDQVSALLSQGGLAHHLVDIGGELRGEGFKSDGSPWWVAIERPVGKELIGTGTIDIEPAGPATSDSARSPPAGDAVNSGLQAPFVVALHGLAIATSGDRRQFFEHAGSRYSHTIDPRTGRPVAHALASVTVIGLSCMHADAHATAMLVMGLHDALAYARKRTIAAVLVSRDERAPAGLTEQCTPALQQMLS